jgi:hypothetical protein
MHKTENVGLQFLDPFRWSADYIANHAICVSDSTDDVSRMGVHIALSSNPGRTRIRYHIIGHILLHILLPHGSDV